MRHEEIVRGEFSKTTFLRSAMLKAAREWFEKN